MYIFDGKNHYIFATECQVNQFKCFLTLTQRATVFGTTDKIKYKII